MTKYYPHKYLKTKGEAEKFARKRRLDGNKTHISQSSTGTWLVFYHPHLTFGVAESEADRKSEGKIRPRHKSLRAKR